VRRTLGDNDKIARLHLHFLVAEPDSPGALKDVLHLVGVEMQMLGCVAVLHRHGCTVGRDERGAFLSRCLRFVMSVAAGSCPGQNRDCTV
jgi:hypothetical protein